MEVDHTVEDGNDPREDLSLGPPKKRPHVQKLAHEVACNNSLLNLTCLKHRVGRAGMLTDAWLAFSCSRRRTSFR